MILSSLMLQKQEEQKKRIDGLDAIKQALMDTSKTTTTTLGTRTGISSNNDTKQQEQHDADGKEQKHPGDDDEQELVSSSKLVGTMVHHVSTVKAKQKLMSTELEHMHLVLQHPAYQKNPFATLQEHLTNSYKKERQVQESISKKRTTKDNKITIQKKQHKKEILRGSIYKKKQASTKKKYKPRRTR